MLVRLKKKQSTQAFQQETFRIIDSIIRDKIVEDMVDNDNSS